MKVVTRKRIKNNNAPTALIDCACVRTYTGLMRGDILKERVEKVMKSYYKSNWF